MNNHTDNHQNSQRPTNVTHDIHHAIAQGIKQELQTNQPDHRHHTTIQNRHQQWIVRHTHLTPTHDTHTTITLLPQQIEIQTTVHNIKTNHTTYTDHTLNYEDPNLLDHIQRIATKTTTPH